MIEPKKEIDLEPLIHEKNIDIKKVNEILNIFHGTLDPFVKKAKIYIAKTKNDVCNNENDRAEIELCLKNMEDLKEDSEEYKEINVRLKEICAKVYKYYLGQFISYQEKIIEKERKHIEKDEERFKKVFEKINTDELKRKELLEKCALTTYYNKNNSKRDLELGPKVKDSVEEDNCFSWFSDVKLMVMQYFNINSSDAESTNNQNDARFKQDHIKVKID